MHGGRGLIRKFKRKALSGGMRCLLYGRLRPPGVVQFYFIFWYLKGCAHIAT